MQKGIMITSNYRIVALDKLNVMVQKYIPSKEISDKEGNKKIVEAKWDNYSYHPNIKQAIKSIANKELNIVAEAGANAIINKINELEEAINNINTNNLSFVDDESGGLSDEEYKLGCCICELIGQFDISNTDNELVVNGVRYALKEIKDWDWSDEGKYSYGECVYQLGIADKNVRWNIEEGKELNIFIMQEATRSGSYFSDYYYDYEIPYLVIAKEVKTKIWEKVKVNK